MELLFAEITIGLAWVLASWTTPREWFHGVTIAATLWLFAWIDPWAAAVLLIVTTAGWRASKIRGSVSKIALLSGVLGMVLLFSFKWFSGWLPLGISYFVFRQIGYQIDHYKGELPQHRFADLLAYQFLAPTILVGPIHRFTPFLIDSRRRRWDLNQFTEGLEKVILGMFKLAFIGNFVLSDRVPVWIENLPVISWHYAEMLRFTFNTYFQFAGYSEVAVGLCAMAGVRVMDNFHRPFSAQNISEFWKRWHISLSSWCRDYIFLPTLASTRNVALALLFSLGLLAMWHETNINYVLWGSAHVLATLIYRWWSCSNGHTWFRKLHPSTKYFGHIITFHFVAWSFTLVRGSGMDAIVEFWHPVIQSLTS